jgi:nicotinamide mononucleotide transporter
LNEVHFIAWLRNNYIEVLGFITSLICVWLNIKANIWGWFWAIVSSAISAVFYYRLKLFGDMNLQFFFIVAAIYGWYQWKFGKKEQQNSSKLPITFLPKSVLPKVVLISLIGFVIVWYGLRQLKGDFVVLDAITTTLSILATWLMARKYVENWVIWIVADVIYVGMYVQKNAQLYAILYAIFLFLAYKGFLEWKNKASFKAFVSVNKS